MVDRAKRVNQRKKLETEITHDNKELCETMGEMMSVIGNKHNVCLTSKISDGATFIHINFAIRTSKGNTLLSSTITLTYNHINYLTRTEKTLKQFFKHIDKDIRRLKAVLNGRNLHFQESVNTSLVKIETRNRYF